MIIRKAKREIQTKKKGYKLSLFWLYKKDKLNGKAPLCPFKRREHHQLVYSEFMHSKTRAYSTALQYYYIMLGRGGFIAVRKGNALPMALNASTHRDNFLR